MGNKTVSGIALDKLPVLDRLGMFHDIVDLERKW